MTTPLLGAIDLHAHHLPAGYRAAALAHDQAHPDGMPALPEWDEDTALATMDRIGIAAAAISLSSPGLSFLPSIERPAMARAVNDAGAGTVDRHRDRFALLATLPLPDVEATLGEIDRAYDTLGADGIGLHTHTDGVYLGDERLDPVLASLDDRGALVTIHPVSPCGWEETAFGRPRPMLEFLFDTTRAVVNLSLAGTFARYPRIRWVVPHAGAALPVIADRVNRFNAAMGGPPTDLIEDLGGLYYDLAGTPMPRALPALLSLVGTDRLLYGSDYPFTPVEAVSALAAALAAASHLEGDARTAAFRGTAAGLLPRLVHDSPHATDQPGDHPR